MIGGMSSQGIQLAIGIKTDVSDTIDLLYKKESIMKKNKIKDNEVCESCGKPKITEAMNHFRAVQEAMKYIRIKDNNINLEELPL